MADELNGDRYRKHPEHYNKWWITKDCSLRDPSYPRIPLEAVSPILSTKNVWEREFEIFWYGWHQVFLKPDASSLCGSHIHVSPFPRKAFSLAQLKDIAMGVIFYEPLIQQLLPHCRQHNRYCRRNTVCSQYLLDMGSDYGKDLLKIWQCISNEIDDEQDLREFMQDSGGAPATRMWISFVLSFIHLCVKKYRRHSMSRFWKDLVWAAKSLNVRQHLPSDWSDMMEPFREDCDEELNSLAGYYSNDGSSIVSKGDPEY
ncbi:putative amidoligase enzyme-domain-containing protein [Xylaria venustula]|nr:putative amidoligase enzyme-domain-containing protein [Xylaria venustula]